MISYQDARTIAKRYLAEMEPADGPELALEEEATLERDFGWVFFYNTRAFVETRRFSDCLAGNAPVIVERSNGQLHTTGTPYPIEHYIDEFEKLRCR